MGGHPGAFSLGDFEEFFYFAIYKVNHLAYNIHVIKKQKITK